MATKHWEGKAAAVAQVSKAQITTYDGAGTYTVTIGGVSHSEAADTDANTTIDNIVAALNLLTHPYFAAITWGEAGTDELQGTADTAGVPFTFTVSATGGTAAWGAVSDTTANVSPNDWSNADNWSDAAVPVNGDTVLIKDTDVSISWGIDQNAIDLAALTVDQSFTGSIGLRSSAFATSSDGLTVDSDATEYRDHYLKIGADDIEIGGHVGPGSPSGSTRIKIHNNEAGASNTIIHNSASAGEGTKPAIMLLNDNASGNIDVRAAPGGFGVAVDAPGETSTIGTLDVSQAGNSARVFIGGGTVFSTFEQRGGLNVVDVSGATNPVLTVHDGTLTIEGGIIIGTLSIYNAATVTDNHDVSSGAHITTLNVDGPTCELDWSKAGHARTVTTGNWNGGTIVADWDDITFTTLNLGERIKEIEVRAI